MHFKCLNYIHMQNKTSVANYVQAKFHHFAMCIEKKEMKIKCSWAEILQEKATTKRSQFWSHLEQKKFMTLWILYAQYNLSRNAKKGHLIRAKDEKKNEKSQKTYNGDGHKSKTAENKKIVTAHPLNVMIIWLNMFWKKKFSGVSSLCKSLNIK